MLEEIKVINASRAYAYDPDDIRLTMLATSQVAGLISQAFDFKDVNIKPPSALFSRPKRTDPPGLVFTNGSMIADDGGIIPVRSLSISSDEVAIIVAAPSIFLDSVFDRLIELVSDVDTPDGSAIIGGYVEVQQSSGISFRAVGFEKILSLQALQTAAASAAGHSAVDSTPFSLDFWFRPSGAQLDEPLPAQRFTIATRIRRNGDLDTFRSIAPMGSDQHIAYLNEAASRL
jgi:hypothetical protein